MTSETTIEPTQQDNRALEVLLVDDQTAALSALGQLSAAFGYNVRVAERGSAALDMLKTAVPDVVVSDVQMPDMDGLELAQRIRADYPDIRIILMSAHSFDQTSQEAMDLRIDAYFRKPFRATELQKVLELIAGKLKLKKE